MSTKLITIDGPGGVGKSTLGQALSERLGWTMLDSGVYYRVFAYLSLKAPYETLLEKQQSWQLDIQPDGNGSINNVPIDGGLLSERVSQRASVLAQYPEVRQYLTKMFHHQHEMSDGLIAIGRDMGSVVFERQAKLKIYLLASAEIRAKRRYQQLQSEASHVSLQSAKHNLLLRDERDKRRKLDPLVITPDQVVIHTDDLDPGQLCEKVYKLWIECKEK